ncbi:unnamed protein product [Brassica rapa]|uniref:Uncharacterized protein n=1 Tax=Brassica campestris TaxID=3711 RepID=A0A8D9HUI3_BRACM|nr:unnamed protein product [Brassica rapa]
MNIRLVNLQITSNRRYDLEQLLIGEGNASGVVDSKLAF